MPAVIQLDVKGTMDPILKHLAQVRPFIGAAEASAATGAARWIRRNSVRQIISELDLPSRVVGKRLYVRRAKRPRAGNAAVARVRVLIGNINPGSLNPRLITSGRTAKGKQAKAIQAANRIYERAWLWHGAKMGAGKAIILQRDYGAGRTPFTAPKISFEHAAVITRGFLAKAEPEFRRLLRASLNRSLGKQGLSLEGLDSDL